MISSDIDVITANLRPLAGLPLTIARRAADIRGFHFGEMRPIPSGNKGAYVLHIQCAWRLEHGDGIYTASSDLWEPSSDCIDDEHWTYEKGNQQDERLAKLLGGKDAKTKSSLNTSGLLVVEAAVGTPFAGISMDLSGGYRLVVFPDHSTEESWRLLGYEMEDHLVITGGAIEPELG